MKVIYVYTTAKYLIADLLQEAIEEQMERVKQIVEEKPSSVVKTVATLKFIWNNRIRIAPTKERADGHSQFWFPLGLNCHFQADTKGNSKGHSLSWGSCWTQVPGVKGTAFLIAQTGWPSEIYWRLEELAKEALKS